MPVEDTSGGFPKLADRILFFSFIISFFLKLLNII